MFAFLARLAASLFIQTKLSVLRYDLEGVLEVGDDVGDVLEADGDLPPQIQHERASDGQEEWRARHAPG